MPSSEQVPEYAVILCAAGTGRRMGGLKKPFAELLGRPILFHCMDRLLAAGGCAQVVVVLHADEFADGSVRADLEREFGVASVACGGATRQESVRSGLAAIRDGIEIVLTHDAARPLLSVPTIEAVARAAAAHGAAIAAVRATETVKRVGAEDRILDTLPRTELWYARTPQGFRRDLLVRAHAVARDDGFQGTDDAQLVERLGAEARVVEDRYDNIKITVPEDLVVAEAILRWQAEPAGGGGW